MRRHDLRPLREHDRRRAGRSTDDDRTTASPTASTRPWPRPRRSTTRTSPPATDGPTATATAAAATTRSTSTSPTSATTASTATARPTSSGTAPYNRWAYCVIDDDFAAVPRPHPVENLQVTLAHEYFHAVQFAYDVCEDPWFMEATADVGRGRGLRRRQRQPAVPRRVGQLGRPDAPAGPLRQASHHYGNWVFFRYLTERWTAETGSLPTIVLEHVASCSSARPGARTSTRRRRCRPCSPARHRRSRRSTASSSRPTALPPGAYDEGGDYPTRPRPRPGRLRRGKRGHRTGSRSGPTTSPASRCATRPAPGPAARLAAAAQGRHARRRRPRRSPGSWCARDNGSVSTSSIRLNRKGVGSTTVPFSSRSVRYVELTRGQRQPAVPAAAPVPRPRLRLRRHPARRRRPDRVLRARASAR